MLVNLHTHTTRCGHAFGTEREYIETAIANGYEVLGFSDHTPVLFPNGYYSHKIRMRPEELGEYISTLQALREEYKDQIQILIGLEVEYYPQLIDHMLEFYRQYPLDYLILGQHYLENEYDAPEHVMKGSSDPDKLRRYVDQSIAAMELGCFTYVAHPDAFLFTGNPEDYDREIRRLCQRAKELNLPLEINTNGILKAGCPNDRFWDIAAEVGNHTVVGLDAHRPEMIANKAGHKASCDVAACRGLTLMDMAVIVHPF